MIAYVIGFKCEFDLSLWLCFTHVQWPKTDNTVFKTLNQIVGSDAQPNVFKNYITAAGIAYVKAWEQRLRAALGDSCTRALLMERLEEYIQDNRSRGDELGTIMDRQTSQDHAVKYFEQVCTG